MQWSRKGIVPLLGIVLSVAGGCGGTQKKEPVVAAPAPPRDPYAACANFETRANEVWSLQIRDEMDFSVRIYKGEIQAVDAELAVNRLDEFTKKWIEISTNLCRNHTDAGTLDSEEYRATNDCLSRALDTQRSVINAVRSGGKLAIAQAQTLPSTIKSCTGEEEDENAATDMRDNPFGKKR